MFRWYGVPDETGQLDHTALDPSEGTPAHPRPATTVDRRFLPVVQTHMDPDVLLPPKGRESRRARIQLALFGRPFDQDIEAHTLGGGHQAVDNLARTPGGYLADWDAVRPGEAHVMPGSFDDLLLRRRIGV